MNRHPGLYIPERLRFMAKLGNFINVSDIRGKVAGTVYTKGRSGPTMRVRVKPKNPKSVAQEAQRAIMTNASRTAIAYDAATIALWKAYAATVTKHQSVSGAAYNPSWITASNSLYLDYTRLNSGDDGSWPGTPPTASYTPPPAVLAVTSGATGTITFTGPTGAVPDCTALIYIGLIPGTARTGTVAMLRFAGYKNFSAGSVHQDYTGFASGSRYVVGYKFGSQDTGQTGPLQFLGTIVCD